MSTSDITKKIGLKILKISGILFLIVAISYGILGIYISSHHEQIVKDINKTVQEKFVGDIKVGDFEVLFFKNFPNLTLEVKNVTVKDSLWHQHKKTLLQAERIYAKVLPWSIIFTNLNINTINLDNTKIDLYVDANGYSNTSALAKRKPTEQKPKSKSIIEIEVDKINLHKVEFISENKIKNKLFDFDTEELKIDLDSKDNGWEAKLDIKTKVNSMAFNTIHGSFAKDKNIEGELLAVFNKEKGQVIVHSDKLSIGETYFKVDAELGVTKTNSKFGIHLFSESILWKSAASLVSNNISQKLYKFDFTKPFEVKCDIEGDFSIQGDPFIHVQTDMKNNEMKALNETVQNCSFKGEFSNDYAKNKQYSDPNSIIRLKDFRGLYKGIPFVTKNLAILNLKKPIASGEIFSDFEITKLNSIFKKELFDFKKGKAKINVKFKGDVVDLKITKPFILGTVDIVNSDFSYIPGNVNWTNNSIQFQFNTDKLIVKNITIKTEKSSVRMSGYSENFMNLFYDNPEKIVLNWNIEGEKIDLGNFLYLLSNTGSKTAKTKKHKSNSTTGLLAKVIHNSSININLNVKEILFKKFLGRDAIAKVSLADNTITLKEVSIKNGKGSYFIKGYIKDAGKRKLFNIQTDIKNIDIAHLLYSFDNFGSTTLTSKTVKGTVNLKTNLNGYFYEGPIFEKKSLSGNLNFKLMNGAFVNYEPIEKVGKYVFPKRNFKNIAIEEITGNVTFKTGIATLEPMEVNTSVIRLDLAGDYGFEGGTNMQVDVHLRNPKKDEGEINAEVKKEKRKKGTIIHLQATENKEGKLKIHLRANNEKLDVPK